MNTKPLILPIILTCITLNTCAASSSSSRAPAPRVTRKRGDFTAVAFLKKSGVDPRKIEHNDSIYYSEYYFNEHVKQVRHLHQHSAIRTCAIFTQLPSEDVPFDELFRKFAINRMAINLVAKKPIQSALYSCTIGAKKEEPLSYAQALQKIDAKMIFEWQQSPECRRLEKWFKTFKKKQAEEEAPFEESLFGPVHKKMFEDYLKYIHNKRKAALAQIDLYQRTLSSFPEYREDED